MIPNRLGNGFYASIDFKFHPIFKTKDRQKKIYFSLLEFYIEASSTNEDCVKERLNQYRMFLIGNDTHEMEFYVNSKNIKKMISCDFFKPWKREQRNMLVCDIALISLDRTVVQKTLGMMFEKLNLTKQKILNELFEVLFNANEIPLKFISIHSLINQFHMNHNHMEKKVKKIMFTSTMSAGKSTLINALIGKVITRTSQEACTNNIFTIYNKPFEDENIHIADASINLNATNEDLKKVGGNSPCKISSYFRLLSSSKASVCLIDTPGINSSSNNNWRQLTYKALTEEKYDTLVYVLNSNMLGTDDDTEYMKYIKEIIPSNKLIFVLNKLDSYMKSDDSILGSIERIKTDLLKIGFINPVVYPISAYFSLLLKLKINNENLDEDEQEIFDLFAKKFNKPEYDLTNYYSGYILRNKNFDNEEHDLTCKAGIYGLERLLMGENL